MWREDWGWGQGSVSRVKFVSVGCLSGADGVAGLEEEGTGRAECRLLSNPVKGGYNITRLGWW